jgi:hypothetical protein
MENLYGKRIKIMIEFILCSIVFYGLVAIPYKLWVISGKYDYLKKDTEAKIQTLEFNNAYYIEQINNYANQVRSLNEQKERYYSFWSDSLNRLLDIEEVLDDMPDSEYKDRINEILHVEDEDNNDI